VSWTLWAFALSMYENAWAELYAFEGMLYEVVFRVISNEVAPACPLPPVVGVFEVFEHGALMCVAEDRGVLALMLARVAESLHTLAVMLHQKPITSTMVTVSLALVIYLAIVAATWILDAPNVVTVAYATATNRTRSGASWEAAVDRLHVKLRSTASGMVYELVYNDEGDIVGYLPERPALAAPEVAGRFEAATLHGTVKPVSTAAAKKLGYIVPLFSCEGPDGVEDVVMVGTGFRVGDCIVTARHVAEIATHAARVSSSGLDLSSLKMVELPEYHTYSTGDGSALDIAYYRCEPRVFSVLAMKSVDIQGDRSPLMRDSMVAIAGFRATDVQTCRGLGRVIARINDAEMQFSYNAPTTPGMSGAPIMIGKKVVGVHLGSRGGAENVNYGCYAVPFLRLAVNPKYTPARLTPRFTARLESPWTSQDRNLFRFGLNEDDTWALQFMSTEDVVETFGIRVSRGLFEYLSDEEDLEYFDQEERERDRQAEDLAFEEDLYNRIDDAAYGYESGLAAQSTKKEKTPPSWELVGVARENDEVLMDLIHEHLRRTRPELYEDQAAPTPAHQHVWTVESAVQAAGPGASAPVDQPQGFGAGRQPASEDSLTSPSTAAGAPKGKRNGKGKKNPPTTKRANKAKGKKSLKASSKSGASKASTTARNGKRSKQK